MNINSLIDKIFFISPNKTHQNSISSSLFKASEYKNFLITILNKTFRNKEFLKPSEKKRFAGERLHESFGFDKFLIFFINPKTKLEQRETN